MSGFGVGATRRIERFVAALVHHRAAGHSELVAQTQRRTVATTAVGQQQPHALVHADDLAAVLAAQAIHINIIRALPRPQKRKITVLAQ